MRSHRFPFVRLALAVAAFQIHSMSLAAASSDLPHLAYFGTYTGGKSQGIYVARFDSGTGKLSAAELAAPMKNPSFLAVDSRGEHVYAVGEVSDFGGKPSGAVSAFRIEQGGRLTLLNTRPSGGSGPCHLALDRTGKCLLVANYNSGTLAAFLLGPDGALGEQTSSIQHRGSSINPQRQEGPHAHFITPDPRNHFALACDLGLDQVLVYRFKPGKGTLSANEPPGCALPPGSGPRHLAFHPTRHFVYVINELGSSVGVFDYNARRGELKQVQMISTLSPNWRGNNTCAEVQVHPSGRFVYASNRGDNSIATFAVDPASGTLHFFNCTPSGGKTPRHFTLDPSGNWLLAENQDSDNVVVFHIDPVNGHPVETGETVEVGAPVCAAFAR